MSGALEEDVSKSECRGALCKIGHVIESLFNSLEELREVESILEAETGEGDRCGSHDLQAGVSVEAKLNLPLALGVLKDMMGTLVSGIKTAPALQEVMVAIRDSSAAKNPANVCEDFTISKQPSSTMDTATTTEAKVVSISVPESRQAERAAVNGSRVCRHTCAHHAEVMDPRLWSELPDHLLAHVFSRLPLPQIFALRWLSKAWSSTSETPVFSQLCAEAHSKLFGIVGHNEYGEFTIAAFDTNSHKWCYGELRNSSYQDILYAHDGGLICFVPRCELDADTNPILVCNPLTNMWTTLPRTRDLSQQEPVLMQLVVDAPGGCYRVLLVCRYRVGENSVESAESFDSRTRQWSALDSGFVYGVGNNNGVRQSCVFDCSLGVLCALDDGPRVYQGLDQLRQDWVIVRDHLFVLRESMASEPLKFTLSEYALESLISGFRKANSSVEIANLEGLSDDFGIKLFASNGFIMLVPYNYDEREEDRICKILEARLYDISAGEWRNLPLANERYTDRRLRNSFLCELRWESIP